LPTAKTEIIESIFRARFNPQTRSLSSSLVTLTDVSEAIHVYNRAHPDSTMSTRNPANFFKDFIRNRASAERNWPQYVREQGFTARQVTEIGNCFEFVPLPEGRTEAFPAAPFSSPRPETPRHLIESVSLPLASRRLGRNDEPWLIQVITRLRIIESHFSLFSSRNIRQLDLLQMSVKLAGTEIDALFLAHEEYKPGEFREVIVTCEAKGGRDDILEDQILRQAKAPFSMGVITQDHVIPIAVKCVASSEVFVVEFEGLDRATYPQVEALTHVSDSIFVIRPPVPGICQ
jgi:hypothetical protein